MPPAAIIFDCDGLLLDTEGCWSVGQIALFERHRRAFEPEHKQALVGRSMAEAGPIYERLLSRPGRGADLTDELVSLVVDELKRTGCTPMPGAVELLDMLRGRVPLGVASNAPRPVLGAALAAAGVADWFEAAVSADDRLDGILVAYRGLVERTPSGRGLVYTGPTADRRARIVIGGGSGHEPAFFGYLGSGLADAAAVGNVFASPSAEPAIEAAERL